MANRLRLFPIIRSSAVVVAIAALQSNAPAGDSCELHWSSRFAVNGVSGVPTELLEFDDGGGSRLYVAGEFTSAGGLIAPNIVRWSGTHWSNVGSGLGASVNALAAYDFGAGPRLIAAGNFNLHASSQIAQWNSSQWQAIPGGFPGGGWLSGLGVFNGELYVSGAFIFPGSSYLVRWNGSQWTGVGAGLASVVWDLKMFDEGAGPSLAVAGIPFPQGVPGTFGIAKWNGTQWQAFGSGVNPEGRALAIFDSGDGPSLYVGGTFTTTPGAGLTVNRIAKWHNGQWSAMGPGFNDVVYALQVFDDGAGPALYAAGAFTASGSTPIHHLAKWNGAAWEDVGGGLDSGEARGLAVFDDDGKGPSEPALYVVGSFAIAGGGPSPGIARWGRCEPAPALCIADIAPASQPDGQVNVDDLLAVINGWGPTDAGDVADINGDLIVNVDDLLAVINQWGVCQ